MNWKLLLGGAALCFGLGYLAGTVGKPSSAEIDLAHDSTKAAVARAQEAEDARAVVEIQARAVIQAHEHAKDSALAVARAAQNRRPTVVDRIVTRESPADTGLARRVATAVVDSLTVHEIRPLYKALAAADSAFAAQGSLLTAERNARTTAQSALRAATAEIAALRSARPSWFSRRVIPALKIAAAAGAGFEVGKHWPKTVAAATTTP